MKLTRINLRSHQISHTFIYFSKATFKISADLTRLTKFYNINVIRKCRETFRLTFPRGKKRLVKILYFMYNENFKRVRVSIYALQKKIYASVLNYCFKRWTVSKNVFQRKYVHNLSVIITKASELFKSLNILVRNPCSGEKFRREACIRWVHCRNNVLW